jgi:hypothetical protein
MTRISYWWARRTRMLSHPVLDRARATGPCLSGPSESGPARRPQATRQLGLFGRQSPRPPPGPGLAGRRLPTVTPGLAGPASAAAGPGPARHSGCRHVTVSGPHHDHGHLPRLSMEPCNLIPKSPEQISSLLEVNLSDSDSGSHAQPLAACRRPSESESG